MSKIDKNDLKKKGGNIFGYIKHLVKDPVKSADEVKARRKELLRFLIISVALFFVPVVVMAIGAVIFGIGPVYTIISVICTPLLMLGAVGVVFSGILLLLLLKIANVLKTLECSNCKAQVKYDENVKYNVLREWEEKQVVSGNNGTHVTTTCRAEVLIRCVCQNCGTPKEFKREFRTAVYRDGNCRSSYTVDELVRGFITGSHIQ